MSSCKAENVTYETETWRAVRMGNEEKTLDVLVEAMMGVQQEMRTLKAKLVLLVILHKDELQSMGIDTDKWANVREFPPYVRANMKKVKEYVQKKNIRGLKG